MNDEAGGHTTRGLWAAFLFALGVTAAAEVFVTVEWSFPYCNDPQAGPASAVFGAPFPYERWSEASSLQYDFVPHLYILNLGILCAAAWPLFRRLSRRWFARGDRRAGILGLGLCLLVGGWQVFRLSSNLWSPVASLEHVLYDSFRELRPVGVALGRHYECSPSSFWFGRETDGGKGTGGSARRRDP